MRRRKLFFSAAARVKEPSGVGKKYRHKRDRAKNDVLLAIPRSFVEAIATRRKAARSRRRSEQTPHADVVQRRFHVSSHDPRDGRGSPRVAVLRPSFRWLLFLLPAHD